MAIGFRDDAQVRQQMTAGDGSLDDDTGHAFGDAVMLDVDTGEVLALASLPSFNPNLIDRASTPNIFNRVTNQVFELGSTFKPISVAAEPTTMSSTETVETMLAMTQPSARPGMASEVNSARTQTASETRNWTGPQAREPRKRIATRVSAA